MNGSRAYSRDTGGGRRLLHVRFLGGGVHIAEIYANGLGRGTWSNGDGGGDMSVTRTAGLAAAVHDAHG